MPSGDSGAWAAIADPSIIDWMITTCESYWWYLVQHNCDPSVAMDRVWDAWNIVISEDERKVLYEDDQQLINALLMVKPKTESSADDNV